MTAEEPKLEHPSVENAKSPMRTWRILFLDCVENLESLKEAAKESGYVVAGATTMDEAWAFLDGTDHADVIVCAAHLEEDSMFTFLTTVRESDSHRNAKFLILSLEPDAVAAQLARSTARAGLLLGADSFVVMPVFDPAELVAQIKRLQPLVPMLQATTSD